MSYVPCGGCGATHPRERCINCLHDFGKPDGFARLAENLMKSKAAADVSLLDHCIHTETVDRQQEWDRYFMGFAVHAATKSKDSTKVGAVLVGPEGEVRLPAFNGPPRGVNDTPDRFERPAKYLYASHAESNLIAFAAREGIRTKGCAVYVTHQPCAACTRTLIQAGIAKVVYAAGTFGVGSAIPEEMQAASAMFREAAIICEALS